MASSQGFQNATKKYFDEILMRFQIRTMALTIKKGADLEKSAPLDKQIIIQKCLEYSHGLFRDPYGIYS
jgi:hypothetical protein